jgi:hypothetical protein
MAYVLAVKRTGLAAVAGPTASAATTAQRVAAEVPAERWLRCNAGDGAKGPRFYDWAQVPLAAPGPPGWGRWLLVRRSIDDPGELAFFVCWGPAGTPLIGLVRVAGARWVVEEGFEQGKGEVGLDHYEVRRYDAWYRHITLAMLAHAFLAVTRATATGPTSGRGLGKGEAVA